MKLPPFATDVEREVVIALARDRAARRGADGLTCSNTRPGRVTRGCRSARGGLSGRALWQRTLAIVADVRAATGGDLPINACGGISTPAEALACLEAGATTVQVYTALIFEGPGVVGELTAGLARRSGDAAPRRRNGARLRGSRPLGCLAGWHRSRWRGSGRTRRLGGGLSQSGSMRSTAPDRTG